MLTFLHSAALWAIAAVSIPILIHLWNVRQGKILQVGNVDLLLASERQQAKSIRLQQLLLLLLRCLLITLLAFVLAKPVFTTTVSSQQQKGWILIPAGQVKVAYQQHKSTIDKLLQNEFELHHFTNRFPLADFEKSINVDDTLIRKTNYWKLIEALQDSVPADLPLFVFTDNALQHFNGKRPSVHANITWNTYMMPDTAATFLASANVVTSGQVQAVLQHSLPSGNTATYQTVDLNNLPTAFIAENDSSGLYLAFTDTLGHKSRAILDTSLLNILIVTGNQQQDAAYVKAALTALKQATGRRMEIQVERNLTDESKTVDWLFWLSEQPQLVQLQSKNKLVYAKGVEKNTSAYLVTASDETLNEAIIVDRLITANIEPQDETIWSTAFGQPLLTKNPSNIYNLYTRFNPAWSSLVWSDDFPAVMQTLIFPEQHRQAHALDKRTISNDQILPVISGEAENKKNTLSQQTDLEKWCWLAALFILFVERWLSHKQKREVIYAAA